MPTWDIISDTEFMEDKDYMADAEQGPCGGKPNRGSISPYFWDFIVIVAGIAVTFAVGGWINKGQDKKQLQSHLEAVKVELEENLVIVCDLKNYFDKTYELSLYLLSKRPQEHDYDSVYAASIYKEPGWSVIYYNPTFNYSSSAYETLKASGMMNLIRDPSFSRAIVNSYRLLQEAKQEADDYMARKTDALFRPAMENKFLFSQSWTLLDPGIDEFFYFLAAPYGLTSLEDARSRIEHTLILF